MKLGFVHIWSDGFAVMLADRGWSICFGDDFAERAMALAYPNDRGHLISIARVDRVMPKTFVGAFYDTYRTRDASFGRIEKRLSRFEVIACAQSLDSALAIQSKLYGIGERAEKCVAIETGPIISAVEKRVYGAAEKELMEALPAIFGGKG